MTHHSKRVQLLNDTGSAEVVHEDTDGIVPRGENRSLFVKEGVKEGEFHGKVGGDRPAKRLEVILGRRFTINAI